VYRAKYQEEKVTCDAARQQRLASMTEAEKLQLRDAERKKRQQKKLRQRRKVRTHFFSAIRFVSVDPLGCKATANPAKGMGSVVSFPSWFWAECLFCKCTFVH